MSDASMARRFLIVVGVIGAVVLVATLAMVESQGGPERMTGIADASTVTAPVAAEPVDDPEAPGERVYPSTSLDIGEIATELTAIAIEFGVPPEEVFAAFDFFAASLEDRQHRQVQLYNDAMTTLFDTIAEMAD